MAASKKLYLEDLRVGDELPTLVKPAIDRVQIARYAGAANDFNPMHVDEPAAREAGMPSVYAHALMPMGFMGQFLIDRLKGGRITRLAVRFVKLVWPGDTLACKGRILARRCDEKGNYFVDVDIWAENQRGELVLKGHATGQLYFNAEDEARQRRGEPPLIVDLSEQGELPRAIKGRPITVKPAAAARSSTKKSGSTRPKKASSGKKTAKPAKASRAKAKPAARSSKK
ncbi:MAG: MaoC family dehydratase [Myxococcales bacterium]